MVGDAGVQLLGQLRQIAEGEQSLNFRWLGVPSGKDYASPGDVAIVVAPDGTDGAVRLFHSDCAGRSHGFFHLHSFFIRDSTMP